MEDVRALEKFIRKVVIPTKARRYIELIQNPRGQKKFLGLLYHEFECVIKDNCGRRKLSKSQLALSGWIFTGRGDFGEVARTIEAGMNDLYPDTGWLIIDSEGDYGVHQPEDIIDDQIQFGE